MVDQPVTLPIKYYVLNSILLIAIPIIIFVLFIIFERYLFKKGKKATAIGGIAGFILALVNAYPFLGMLGYFLQWPFQLLFYSNCGESCWGRIIAIGSGMFLLLGYVIGWIIEKIRK